MVRYGRPYTIISLNNKLPIGVKTTDIYGPVSNINFNRLILNGTTSDGFRIENSNNINITNSVVHGCGGDGIKTSGSSNVNVKNSIVVNNTRYGINATDGAVTSTYNDVWNNYLGNYNGTSAGTGDISANPLFVDPANGDFHLKSTSGRWDPVTNSWVYDNVDSPCIDAGDPADDFSNELLPNGGRINMGAYGNTAEASKGPVGTITGTVTDDTGNPIEGATVTAGVYTTTTNSSGSYSMTISVGTYTVTASKSGYQSQSVENVQVNKDETTLVDFSLIPDTESLVITNVNIINVTSSSATITWQTNKPSDSLVKYGTTSGTYSNQKYSSELTTSHSITITDLQPSTTYYFVVNSTDADGNSNETSEHSFITSAFKYMWIEAEDADITPDFELAYNSSASNSTYIWIPEGTGWNSRNGTATYTVNIENAGEYVIWGRVLSKTTSDNSFFVQFDDGSEYLWTINTSDNWIWDAVNHWGSGTEENPEIDPVVFNLTAGIHTLKIKQREDGTKLDMLIITNGLSFIPTHVPPKLISCDENGVEKDNFTDEPIYIKCTDLTPDSSIRIYIVNNTEWFDGKEIVPVRVINETSDSEGEFFGVVWDNPEEGYYDIVVDANRDGYYNVSIDAVDHVSAEPGVTATVTSTQIFVNNQEFGNVTPSIQHYFKSENGSTESVNDGEMAVNIANFSVIDFSSDSGFVEIGIGENMSLPDSAMLLIDDDRTPNINVSDDPNQIQITGINGTALITYSGENGDNKISYTSDGYIYVFLNTGSAENGNIMVDIVLSAE